jgi:hypothetical protein
MAGPRVALPAATVDPAARPAVDAYLAELADGLPGSRNARAAILAEIGDGLAETVERHQALGKPPERAATDAVAEFGDPQELAASLATELAGSTARRVGLALLGTGPLVGLLWLTAFAARSGGRDWRDTLGWLASGLPGLPLLLVLVVPMAVLATGGAGRFARLLPVGPRQAAGMAGLAAVGCAVCDAVMITTMVTWTVHGGAPSLLAVAALTISGIRLTVASLAARRCSVLRAAAA